jgi:hypothetical protein
MIECRNDNEILLRFGAWLESERAYAAVSRLAEQGAETDLEWQAERSCAAIRQLAAVPATGPVGIALKLFALAHCVFGAGPNNPCSVRPEPDETLDELLLRSLLKDATHILPYLIVAEDRTTPMDPACAA